MSSPPTDLDPRILAALERSAWAEVADMLAVFKKISPSAAPWIEQLDPILRAAAANPQDAALTLLLDVYEKHPPREVHERVTVGLAKALEDKLPWVAASMYTALKDDKLIERGAQVARRAGGKPEEIHTKAAEALAADCRARLEQDEWNRNAMVRLATALVAAEPVAAYTAAERATQAEPTARRAWQHLAELNRRARGDAVATEVYERAAKVNPTAAWPYVDAAKGIADTEFERGLKLADRALAVDPTDADALELRRRFLRKLERWQELAEHLEYMTSQTSDRLKLSELYDEWARTTSGPLKDAVGAIELSKQSDFFKDERQVADFYWKTLQENEKDRKVWDEVDEFFRQNRMWADLGKLLVMRIERGISDQRPKFVDELRIVWQMVPGRGDAAWADVVQAEIDRAEKDEGLKKALEERLVGVELPEEEKEKADVGTWAIYAAAAVLVVAIIVGGLVLMPFFL